MTRSLAAAFVACCLWSGCASQQARDGDLARAAPDTSPPRPANNHVDGAGCPVAPVGSPVAAHGQLRVQGRRLLDQNGRPVQLKGVSSMWLNWDPTGYAERRDALRFMRDQWKLSVIRAAMGITASKGYLTGDDNREAMQERVEAIVQNALALGVYVIVDWHSEKAYLEQAESVAFFTALARKFGACPNVIYEDYNEPTHVTWDTIRPYHQAIVEAIRAVDPDNLIVLGTPTWSQDVDVAADTPVKGENLLYTLHFYACSHKDRLRAKADAALAKGVALFVSEFGATPANGGVPPENIVCEPETRAWFDWMAANDISGVAWKLVPGRDSSCLLAGHPPADGPWTDDDLSGGRAETPGHGLLVVNWLRQ